MKQRIDEWLNISDEEFKGYFIKQWDTTYRSTILFCDWLDSLNILDKIQTVCDMGCGAGANTYYMKHKFNHLQMTGIDISPKLIDYANSKNTGIKYEIGDIYNLDNKYKDMFDGIIMFQVLSWLPEYREAFKNIVKLNSGWIAFSCLMHDALVECNINIKDYSRNEYGNYQEKFYNVYSIEKIKELLKSYGYNIFYYKPYYIDIDIPKDINNKGMGTYTKKLEDGKRIQISGGLLLNWYFAIAIKEDSI